MKSAIWENLFARGKENENPEIAAIKQVPLFGNLKQKELEEISRLLHHRLYQNNETVFESNTPAQGLYIILSGKVDIYFNNELEDKDKLASLHASDFFGDLSLVEDELRTITAVSKEKTSTLVFFRSDLISLIHRNPSIGVKILANLVKVLGSRLRKADELLNQYQTKFT